jgi:hypothetical protein
LHDGGAGAIGSPSGASTGGITCGLGTIQSGQQCVPSVGADSGGAPGDASVSAAADGGGAGVRDAAVSMFDGGSADGGGSADASAEGGYTGIDVSKSCLVSDNIFVIAGDDYIHSGSPLFIRGGAGWLMDIDRTLNGAPSSVTIEVPGSNWGATFSTDPLGQPLAPGNYVDAERASPFAQPGHPGLDVWGDARGCSIVSGSFQVIAMTWVPGGQPKVTSFTATFVQHCDAESGTNVGCVHVSQ